MGEPEFKKNSLRVMLISPDFGAGGAERSIAKLSFLLNEFCDVHFVVFNKCRPSVYPTAGNIYSLDVPAGNSIPGKLFRLFQRIKRAKRLKKKLNISVSISFLEGADYVNVFSREQDKTIISIRSSKESDEEISGVIGWIRKLILLPWLCKSAKGIVCVSEGIRFELIRTMSLLNGFDIIMIPDH